MLLHCCLSRPAGPIAFRDAPLASGRRHPLDCRLGRRWHVLFSPATASQGTLHPFPPCNCCAPRAANAVVTLFALAQAERNVRCLTGLEIGLFSLRENK